MTSRHLLSARLDALVESLASCSLPAAVTMALEAAAALMAEEEGSSLQKGYRAFFDAMLKKYSVSSPTELSDEQKAKFFDECDKGWKAGDGPTEKAKEDLALKASRRAAIKARLANETADRKTMAAQMTPPIYDQAFFDGMAALDAGFYDARDPNMVVVKVYNIGDADDGEEDWVVEVRWAYIEEGGERTSGDWTTDRYPLPKPVMKLLESGDKMTRQEAVTKAKTVIQLLKAAKIAVHTKITDATA